MIDHVELNVRDQKKSAAFYIGALAPLGYAMHADGKSSGFGTSADKLDFWVREAEPSIPPPHVAFHCTSHELVDLSYHAAIAAGGKVRQAPKLMPQVHAHYYAGMIYDPDGHNIEFACHREE